MERIPDADHAAWDSVLSASATSSGRSAALSACETSGRALHRCRVANGLREPRAPLARAERAVREHAAHLPGPRHAAWRRILVAGGAEILDVAVRERIGCAALEED